MKKSRKKVILTCLECGEIIVGGSNMSRHVKNKHGYLSYDEYKIKHNLIKTESQLKNEGAIECKLCGLLSHDLTSHVLRTHKIDIETYKKTHGEIRSKTYLENQSNNIKGEKNPGFNHGGKLSPLSINFIYYDEGNKEKIIEKISSSNKNNGNTNTTLAYWIRQGYTEEEAKQQQSNRQSTFSLEKCIEKYGKEEGEKIWLKRQEKWIDSVKKTRKNGFSKISQILFWDIFNKIEEKEYIYFAELNKIKEKDTSGKNNEYRLSLSNRIILPDFLDLKNKKIIEFDGTYWHNEKQIKNPTKLRDFERDQLATQNGFFVFRVKEDDYRKNPTKVLQECLEFLNG
jgi:NADH:ubiquinone oxidoreductase subunit C